MTEVYHIEYDFNEPQAMSEQSDTFTKEDSMKGFEKNEPFCSCIF